MRINSCGRKNGNWKGGISLIESEDALLQLEELHLTNLKDRFYSKVRGNDDECWIWLGSTFNGRYGRYSIGKKSFSAHRISYVLSNGPIGNLLVCHSCDNILCVRPDHLWLGTPKDNTQDMLNKNRGPEQKGSKNPQAKLIEKDVKKIRAKYNKGCTLKELAISFEVSIASISNIVRRKSWSHI
jgi:TPR repeat protein